MPDDADTGGRRSSPASPCSSGLCGVTVSSARNLRALVAPEVDRVEQVERLERRRRRGPCRSPPASASSSRSWLARIQSRRLSSQRRRPAKPIASHAGCAGAHARDRRGDPLGAVDRDVADHRAVDRAVDVEGLGRRGGLRPRRCRLVAVASGVRRGLHRVRPPGSGRSRVRCGQYSRGASAGRSGRRGRRARRRRCARRGPRRTSSGGRRRGRSDRRVAPGFDGIEASAARRRRSRRTGSGRRAPAARVADDVAAGDRAVAAGVRAVLEDRAVGSCAGGSAALEVVVALEDVPAEVRAAEAARGRRGRPPPTLSWPTSPMQMSPPRLSNENRYGLRRPSA